MVLSNPMIVRLRQSTPSPIQRRSCVVAASIHRRVTRRPSFDTHRFRM
jgi:hypothetical protein